MTAWDQVDRQNGIVTLEARETKNDKGRTIYLDNELKELFQSQWQARQRSGKLCEYVFRNEQGTGPVGDFRKTWNAACRDRGLGSGHRVSKERVDQWKAKILAGLILHDFRRTAVRNMVRSGIPERVAMMISGRNTRSVLERYNV